MAAVLKVANTLASGAGLYQDKRNHDLSLKEEELLHQKAMKEMQDQFSNELQSARRIYLLSMYADMETYFQELNENLISSSRDAERDMVDQRNQQFQTILISATIMLATLLNIMFQGTLPENLPWLFYAGFAFFNTLSLITLVISVALCIMITSRVTKFMYRKSDTNIKHLRKAMRHTKDMMRNLRGNHSVSVHQQQQAQAQASVFGTAGEEGYVNDNNSNNSNNNGNTNNSSLPQAFPSLDSLPDLANTQTFTSNPDTTNQSTQHDKRSKSSLLKFGLRPQLSRANTTTTRSSSVDMMDPPSPVRPILVNMRRNIALLSDDDINAEWLQHEKQVTEYLTHRSRLAERLEAMAVEQENQERMSFELFWSKYCRTMANTTLVLFYIGTNCLLVGTIIFTWTLFIEQYASPIAAIASVATIGISMLLCCVLAIYLRFFDVSIALLNAQMAREQHQDAKKYWQRMWDALKSARPTALLNPVTSAENKEN